MPALRPPRPHVPRRKLVGSRCGLKLTSVSSSGSRNQATRTRHLIYGKPADIQPVYPGFDLGGAPNTNERASPVSVYLVRRASIASAGTAAYAAGEVVTLPKGASEATAARLLCLSAGTAPKLAVLDPGCYDAPLADGGGQASTTGSGAGATFNLEWEGAAYVLRVSAEPDWASQATAGLNAPRQARTTLADNSKSADVIVRPGELALASPIPIRAGSSPQAIGLRLWTRGVGVARGRNSVAGQEFFSSGSSGDITAPGATYAGNAQGQFTEPAAILGLPTMPTVAGGLISDSTGFSQNEDGGDADGHIGWFERGMAARGLAFVNLSRSGDAISNLFGSAGRAGRMALLRLCALDFVVVALGINDFGASSTYANVAGYEQQLAAELRGLGIARVFTTTTTPMSTSTDGWTSVAGQALNTANGRSANAALRNAALRAGTHPAGYDGFLDWGPLLEAPGSPGLWAVGPGGLALTLDGIHSTGANNVSSAAYFAAWLAGQSVPAS